MSYKGNVSAFSGGEKRRANPISLGVGVGGEAGRGEKASGL